MAQIKKNTSKKIRHICTIITVLPNLVFAYPLQDLLPSVGGVLRNLIPVVFGIVLLVFFWGLAKFIFNAGDEKKIEEGKRIMVWGIIALFVMVSIWGIIRLIQGDLGLQNIRTINTQGP